VITNDKIAIEHHHLVVDVHADGEMDTSYRNGIFATREFVKHGDVRQSDVCWYSGCFVPYLQCDPVPQHIVSVCVLMTRTLGSVHSRRARNTMLKRLVLCSAQGITMVLVHICIFTTITVPYT